MSGACARHAGGVIAALWAAALVSAAAAQEAPEAGIEAETEPGTEAETEPGTETEPEPLAETAAETETETESVAGSEPGSATEAVSRDELEASIAVLETGVDRERERTDEDGGERTEDGNLFEISAATLVTASGGQPETNLLLDDAGWRVEDLLRPRRDLAYPSLWVSMYAEVEMADWLLFRGLIDTREIRDGDTLEPPIDGLAMGGNDAEDELADGTMLRELSAVFAFGAFSAELGRFRSDVADGLVYKDFGAGLRLRLDLDQITDDTPLTLELLLTSIGQRVQDIDNNGLLGFRVDWNLDTFESVSFLVAFTEDENGEVSEVLRSAYAEHVLDDQQKLNSLFLQEEGGGGLAYLGAMAHIVTASYATLDARVVLMTGNLQLSVPLEEITTADDVLAGREVDVEIGGLAADVMLRYGVNDFIDLTGFAVLMSGDEPPRGGDDDRYESFIGVGPLWDWTGLFFSGGINQGLYPNRAAAAGVNGRGVFAIGPGIEISDGDWEAEARALLLSSTVDPPEEPLSGGGKGYGAELDMLGRWRATRWLSLGLEVDLLLPGKFFPHDDLAYLAIGMVTLSNAL